MQFTFLMPYLHENNKNYKVTYPLSFLCSPLYISILRNDFEVVRNNLIDSGIIFFPSSSDFQSPDIVVHEVSDCCNVDMSPKNPGSF